MPKLWDIYSWENKVLLGLLLHTGLGARTFFKYCIIRSSSQRAAGVIWEQEENALQNNKHRASILAYA